MKTGDLDQRVKFQRARRGRDGFSTVVLDWADLGTLWANVRETPGRETVIAGRVEASRTATIRVYASSLSRAVTEMDRVVWNGFLWNISSGPVRVPSERALVEFLVQLVPPETEGT